MTGQLLRGAPIPPLTLLIALGSAVAGTLVALSATMRRGVSRALYVLLAAATSLVAFALVEVGRSVPGALAFCAVVALPGAAPVW